MEERMNLAEAFSALAGYGAAVWCGVAAAIATFVIEIILCKKGILFASGEKKIARAILQKIAKIHNKYNIILVYRQI